MNCMCFKNVIRTIDNIVDGRYSCIVTDMLLSVQL